MPWVGKTTWLEPEADGLVTVYQSDARPKIAPETYEEKTGRCVWDIYDSKAELVLCRNMQKYREILEWPHGF